MTVLVCVSDLSRCCWADYLPLDRIRRAVSTQGAEPLLFSDLLGPQAVKLAAAWTRLLLFLIKGPSSEIAGKGKKGNPHVFPFSMFKSEFGIEVKPKPEKKVFAFIVALLLHLYK